MLDIHALSAAAYSVSVDGDDFRFLDANSACLALTGLMTEVQPGLTPSDIFEPAVAQVVVERYRACCAGSAVSYESRVVLGGALRRWRTTIFCSDAHERKTIYGICSPIDETRLSDGSIDDVPMLVLDAFGGGFWTYDTTTGEFVTCRRLAEKLAGPGHASLNLAEYVSYVHADDLRLELPDTDGEMTVEFRVFTYDGRLRWLRTRRRPVRDRTGRSTRVVGAVMDITDEKLTLLRLEKESVTDGLTCIGNRRAFDRAAVRCFGEGSDERFGIVVIDLDGFKLVNDQHGHVVGDAVLHEYGQRLAQLVAAPDLLARIGGDEFAVIVANATQDRLDALVEAVDVALQTPFRIGDRTITLGASCGIALRLEGDRSIGDLVSRADRALYGLKDRRRSQVA